MYVAVTLDSTCHDASLMLAHAHALHPLDLICAPCCGLSWLADSDDAVSAGHAASAEEPPALRPRAAPTNAVSTTGKHFVYTIEPTHLILSADHKFLSGGG